MHPPLSHIKWNKTYRLINSCYPSCDIWEDIISNSEDWQIAFEIEAMANDRVRQEIGNISLVPKERMVTGANSWWVISAFTKINPNGSRFCDGTYGAYYAGKTFITALKEKAFGVTTEFMAATNEDIIDLTYRVLVGKIDSKLHDIRDVDQWKQCYLKNNYKHSQKLGRDLRENESEGIIYKSVRNEGGECFAVFWPDVVSIPIQERHVVLHWDRERISSYFVVGEDKAKRRQL